MNEWLQSGKNWSPQSGDVYLEIPDKMTLGPFIFNISPFIRILKKMYIRDVVCLESSLQENNLT